MYKGYYKLKYNLIYIFWYHFIKLKYKMLYFNLWFKSTIRDSIFLKKTIYLNKDMRLFVGLICILLVSCTETKKENRDKKNKPKEVEGQVYQNTNFHNVIAVKPVIGKKVKNIVFMIGDGMGLSQIFSGITANKGHLNLEYTTHIGFSKTSSSDNYTTDSAASATALATGVKTYNGAIGVDNDKKPLKTILEIAEEKGLATGLVATSKITHATPASFIAHQPSRKMDEEIAADFLKTDIDVFIGGGKKFFDKREDGQNLLKQLQKKGYQVVNNQEDMTKVTSGKLAALLYEGHMPRYTKRGEILLLTTLKALEILSQNEKGFFLMVEGSQIDWGGHANDISYIVEEMLDFDRTIGKVMEFAEKDGETLVIITADHETGGFAVKTGNHQGKLEGRFLTGGHTAVMVPVFSYGPQSERFKGFYENNQIFFKMMRAYRFIK